MRHLSRLSASRGAASSRRSLASISLGALALLVAGCGGGGGGSDGPEIFFAGHRSAVYEGNEHWLCRPGLPGDVCHDRLDVTAVAADGTLSIEPFDPVPEPTFDCFYVYPTVRLGAEGNAPFDGDYQTEIFTTRTQAAHFGKRCAVYAPVYRQRTLSAPRDTGVDHAAIAYADVLDAFRTYLGHFNHGRPFVVLGHSQGASHLRRLVAEEIDPVPGLRDRLISALLLGATVEVPIGQDVGGSFQQVPACRDPDQYGCVISYASFRATVPPPPTSLFGRARAGMQALCTNPADLHGGAGNLTPYFNIAENSLFSRADQRIAWAPEVVNPPAIRTPFIKLPDLVHAACTANDTFSYLVLSMNADPVGPRADDIGGDLTPDWGMHLVDVNVALEQLVEIVGRQARSWFGAHGR